MLTPHVPSQQLAHYAPYHVNASSDNLGWRGFRVEVVRNHAPGEIRRPLLDHHLLNMIVSTRTRHEHRWDGKRGDSIGEEGSLSLVPAGCESYWRWEYLSNTPPCDFHIHLHPDFVRRTAVRNLSELKPGLDLRAELCFLLPELRILANSLLRETEAGGPHGALYAESLATALTTLLLNMQEPWRKSIVHSEGRTPIRQIRTGCDYIEAHLGEDLHLETLSDLAGFGPERLRDYFRAYLGETPHRYVTRRRLERARDLLRNRRTPITDIALQLGFSDHSHFTSTFHREIGITPSRFRMETRR